MDKKNSKLNILVTGSSGFIGKKLVQCLKKLNHNVLGIDFKEDLNHTNYIIDISDSDFDSKIEIKEKIDIIYHLAAQSGGYMSLKDPYKDSLWNCVGTSNIIKLSKKLGIKKFIYISSMAVYGNSIRVDETSTPNPISFYGVSKLNGEFQTKLLLEHCNINYTIFRLFATYGSGQDLKNLHQGILSIYLSQILSNNEVKLTGLKTRIRELIHVDDVINALILGLKTETNNQIYNVSNNEFITPEIIINEISSQLNKRVNIIELKGYVGDQTFITSKLSLLHNLGWRPRYNLKQGVKEFLDNIKI